MRSVGLVAGPRPFPWAGRRGTACRLATASGRVVCHEEQRPQYQSEQGPGDEFEPEALAIARGDFRASYLLAVGSFQEQQ